MLSFQEKVLLKYNNRYCNRYKYRYIMINDCNLLEVKGGLLQYPDR